MAEGEKEVAVSVIITGVLICSISVVMSSIMMFYGLNITIFCYVAMIVLFALNQYMENRSKTIDSKKARFTDKTKMLIALIPTSALFTFLLYQVNQIIFTLIPILRTIKLTGVKLTDEAILDMAWEMFISPFGNSDLIAKSFIVIVVIMYLITLYQTVKVVRNIREETHGEK